MIEDTRCHVSIVSINDNRVLYEYEVTGTELDWLYENMREPKGHWNFSNDSGEHLINLNNVTEIVSEEVQE